MKHCEQRNSKIEPGPERLIYKGVSISKSVMYLEHSEILKYDSLSRNHLKGSIWEQHCQWSKDAVKLVGILTQRQW